MRTLRILSLWAVLALMAGAVGLAAAQLEPAPATADWSKTSWQIRSLPTINALEFTAEQLEKILPVLKQTRTQLDEATARLLKEERTAKKLGQLRQGLLQGTLGQADVDNERQWLDEIDQKTAALFEALPAVAQLKTLLTAKQKSTLEGAVLLPTRLAHRPPIPAPPSTPAEVDMPRWRAGQVIQNVRQMTDAEYKEKRTEWATRLVERATNRDDPNFANKVAALAAIFDGVRKLTEDQLKAQRDDLINQVLPYTGGEDVPAPPPPPPPPPFAGTAGHPNLSVLIDPQVMELLELKLTYLKAAAR